MIIFLYGEDSYRTSQKLKEIVSGYKAKNPSGFNLVNFDLSDDKIEDFFESAKSTSLIQEKKLVIAKNIFSNKTDSESVLKFLKRRDAKSGGDIILVFIHYGDSLKNKLFEYLIKKPNQSQNFKPLNSYEIKNWVKKFLNSFEVELTGEALDCLVSSCGPNLWRLDNEIRKIANYKVKGIVSKSQIEELLVPGAEYNIFELTDALAKKDKKKALTALYGALDNGEAPTELLGLLAWQIRNLLIFKNSPAVFDLKLHPFVLGKIKESAKNFSTEELGAILSKIIDLDLAFKTTDVSAKTALSLLISEL